MRTFETEMTDAAKRDCRWPDSPLDPEYRTDSNETLPAMNGLDCGLQSATQEYVATG
jgi:hypothetical protein